MKVAELNAPHLDYWVAIAEGKEASIVSGGCAIAQTIKEGDWRYEGVERKIWITYNPSSNWTLGGPIIARIKPYTCPGKDNLWFCNIFGEDDKVWIGWGETLLIAFCRSYVASRFGYDVPAAEEQQLSPAES